MSLYRPITLCLMVAVAGCSDNGADTTTDPVEQDPAVTSAPATSPKYLDYSFQEPDAAHSKGNLIEDFSEQDIRDAMRTIPWAPGVWASIVISLDGANSITIGRDSEDELSGDEIVADLALIADGQLSVYRSPPLRDSDEGLRLLLSFYRGDTYYRTAVKWTRTE